MRRIICSLLLAVLLLSGWSEPVSAVGTSARAAILVDADSGRALYEQNADEQLLIASITKMMTAVVALENCPTDRLYQVQSTDMAEGSSMYLAVGEELTLEELLYGLMLSSGNDAALAVAHCVAGTVEDFVALMNDKAKELGLANTSFANPNGLDAEGHYSSARDMATLASYAMENEAFSRIVSTKSITIGARTLTNHNRLLSSYEGCVGIKTGYTKAAGRTLVSAAVRQEQLLIAVTLSDGNDWQDHQNLFDYGYASYPKTAVLKAEEQVGTALVKGSSVLSVPVLTGTGFSYPLAASEVPEVSYRYYEQITAPVVAGAVVGEAVISLQGGEIGRVPLICGEDVGMTLPRN